jgi:hypothetical protein
MTPTVLITGAGHASALTLIEAFRSEGVNLIACDEDPRAAGLRLLPPERRLQIHASGSPEFVGDLLSFCLRSRIDLIVACDLRDVPALLRSRQLFERLGTRLWLDPACRAGHTLSARRALAACNPSATQRFFGSLTSSASRLLRALGVPA